MILLSALAPATPITSDRLLTSPSLTPKMAARSVPARPARCQASSSPVADRGSGLGTADRPAGAGEGRHGGAAAATTGPAAAGAPAPARKAGIEPLPDLRVLALIGHDRGHGRVRLRLVELFLVAFQRLDEVRYGAGPEDACQADDETHPRTRTARAGTSTPASRSRDAQISACRRSLPAMARNAAARRGSFSIAASRS